MEDSVKQKMASFQGSGKEFIIEVAKYFMDFLESDFHKHKNPRRTIKLHNNDNLLVGVNLGKYPTFVDVIWNTIRHSFGEDQLKTVSKGVYKVNIPENLLNLIKIQIGKISSKDINQIITKISKEVQEESIINKQEYDQALANTLENVSKAIKTTFVLPFLSSIEKPLDNLHLTDENGIYLMEVELTDILTKQVESKISEILQLLIAKEKVNVEQELKPLLDLKDVKAIITTFFEAFKVTDLFSEVYELMKNQNILDKQEFYLYFGDITYSNIKYPIFYIPFSVERISDSININFEPQVYINKKALEFITQEFNREQEKRGNLKLITERIIYINDDPSLFATNIQDIFDELVNFFSLDEKLDTKDSKLQLAKSFTVRISNSIYFSLFDKSDEALVNDYEDILQLLSAEEESILGEKFNSLINDFLYKDPSPFNPAVEEEWDNLEVSEKLIARSPIPLNSEQLQLLSALKKDDCSYITVEGPPGTGKSHTITAIAFNAILENKSILVLSDKKEALDVVEDKITQTLNKVRLDKNFQNPLLRLGKTGSTYNQILATSAIENIKANYRVVKSNHASVESDIDKRLNSLNEDLQAEIYSYSHINIDEIYEFFNLEEFFITSKAIVDKEEIVSNDNGISDLDELRSIFLEIKGKLEDSSLTDEEQLYIKLSGFSFSKLKNIEELQTHKIFLAEVKTIFLKLHEIYKDNINNLKQLGPISDKDVVVLEEYVTKYENEKNWILGYTFKKDKIKKLDADFQISFPQSTIKDAHSKISLLEECVRIYKSADELQKQLLSVKGDKFDYIKFVSTFIISDQFENYLEKIETLEALFSSVNLFKEIYPLSAQNIGINNSLETFHNNKLTGMTDLDFEKLLRYLSLLQKISKEFKGISFSDYSNQKKIIEDLMITQMTYIMDGRLIDFYENSRATAKTLREIIKKKQKFPKDEFSKLKEAFPCILAGIRDYAEYIPLEPDIFDLVIIDEASQVSIAQAFPALLRAKKVLILGDKKQFSNVKAAQARSDTNTEYLNNLKSVFTKHISKENAKLVKLEKFNIKTSILDFFEFISNYNIQLIKHFRGYKEIISYSNKYFYQDSLQVMKIRGKKISDVLKFKIIESDGKTDLIPTTNSLEIDYIISELEKMHKDDQKISVGIITPHTDQQKLLSDRINKLPERDYYFKDLKLKIMTFDTCQGEERDTIFYSMVATPQDDRLGYIFISDLNSINIEEDGKIKAQRLNVGFSRAQETMHFVLSKKPEEFSGSIGNALMHYKFALEEAKKERDVSETDKNSPMEKEVMNWFYQTQFWKNNKDNIDFFPQFELGQYLKQLNKSYNHPAYKTDFLLVYIDERKREHKIIIEYDGFKEHFKEDEDVNEFNYQDYYNDQDVYREKVLESYGYKFLRINRFNIGKSPIETLNQRIEELVKNRHRVNPLLDDIHSTIENLQNGKMKECPKCGEFRDAYQFEDKSLITGIGKFCNLCKKKSVSSQTPIYLSDHENCPNCNSKMVLRNGKYGKFYGCSKFPYCRGTRQYND
ncbi:MAG: AAA domain-containing protein [Patescibacteria group bacterium]